MLRRTISNNGGKQIEYPKQWDEYYKMMKANDISGVDVMKILELKKQHFINWKSNMRKMKNNLSSFFICLPFYFGITIGHGD